MRTYMIAANEGEVTGYFIPSAFKLDTKKLTAIMTRLQQNADAYEASWDLSNGIIRFTYNPLLRDGSAIIAELNRLFETSGIA